MLSFEDTLPIIEHAVRELRFDDPPQSLFDPIVYTLSLGGKRIRPAFTLMACNLYSSEVEQAIKPALGIEVFHNFTLLHDDLMDEARKRRGQPTVHVKWNRNTAVLSGDAMLITAYRLIGETSSELLKKRLDLYTRTALEICEGQQYDMEFESRPDVTEAEYLEMIRLKTAVLLACSLKTGALIGGASEHEADILYRFGIYIGLAFQLQDDLLDVYGSPETFGKNIGGDILCNKKTFLLIHTLASASPEQKEQIVYYQHPDKAACYTADEKIKAITSIYDQLNIRELTQEQMKHYYNLAMDELALLKIPQERLSELHRVCRKLMNREK